MAEVTLEEVHALVTGRIVAVLGVDAPVDPDARFAEDLHADSLDLVEIVEGVERALAERGLEVALEEEQLLALETVRDAARQLHAAASERRW